MIYLIGIIILLVVAPPLIKRLERYLIGKFGERFVSKKLLGLDAAHYKILNDLLLPSRGNLNTTQIDHVVVSNYGIFCVETKTYKGWIFGDVNQEYWTQVIYRHKDRFYNPLRQNYAHVKAVEELIRTKYPAAQFYSLIAFPDAEKLQISGTDSVGSAQYVVDKIKSYTNVILSDPERDDILNILVKANIQDKEIRKTHDRGVRNLKR